MSENGLVRWSNYINNGPTEHGYMPLRQVQPTLVEYQNFARNVLRETGADHVVYGMKLYDKDGELSDVHLYMLPMDEKTFDRTAARCRNSIVYALHRR